MTKVRPSVPTTKIICRIYFDHGMVDFVFTTLEAAVVAMQRTGEQLEKTPALRSGILQSQTTIVTDDTAITVPLAIADFRYVRGARLILGEDEIDEMDLDDDDEEDPDGDVVL